jgi:hypothetical protein
MPTPMLCAALQLTKLSVMHSDKKIFRKQLALIFMPGPPSSYEIKANAAPVNSSAKF